MESCGKAGQNLRLNKASPGNSIQYCQNTLQKTIWKVKKEHDSPASRGSFSFKSQVGSDSCKTLWIPRYVVRAWKKVCFLRGRNWRRSDVYLSMSIYLCLSISIYLLLKDLSIYLIIYLPIYLSFFLHVYLSTCLYQSTYRSTYLSVYLSICISLSCDCLYLSIYQST